MKILDIEKIREADRFTIENEPISSIDLMERAGKNCTKWIRKKLNKEQDIFIFVGPGNNGGDGLVIARLLAEKKYKVTVVMLLFTEHFSDDFTINLNRLEEQNIAQIVKVRSKEDIPKIDKGSLIIDAIFGSGLNRAVSGFVADAIQSINENDVIVVSIDIPSGLFADEFIDSRKNTMVHADYTLSLQFPKYSFMFSENEFIIGELDIIDIGLHPQYINTVKEKALLIDLSEAAPLLRPRSKFSHKGTYGHALLIAGSYGKMGAAVLASKASLRSGLGLLTTHIPKSGVNILQTATPETMLSIDPNEFSFSKLPNLSNFSCVGIGPGLGKDPQSGNALKLLIQEMQSPMLLDADALNILSENKTWLSFLPKNSILTPHPKEFERLAGKSSNSAEKLEKQKEFAIKHQVIVVLKGAHTSIATPDGKLFFNSTGNPGMATAGSGDVLTGIILALLSQNYPPIEAAILGVYIHGLAGDIAAKKKGFEAMIASDIVKYLGKAFGKLKI
ncbi:MAG: bifunctional ADP-dependent NAD(P)H-hydrate dehydratase/NAD(P)H-hydrate epimerase [Bacteroidetes bacterium]|nr:MAG: bifunctional ADP-dependent NAD(P)H-hydrate dehydratase/NAD(P)H-hydrate epimerase [Bacteroidota bacterium]